MSARAKPPVWVLTQEWPNYGSKLVGVFSSIDKAKAQVTSTLPALEWFAKSPWIYATRESRSGMRWLIQAVAVDADEQWTARYIQS